MLWPVQGLAEGSEDGRDCLKMVFNKFCLGGPAEILPVNPIVDAIHDLVNIFGVKPDTVEKNTLYFPDESVLVLVSDNKVAFIRKKYDSRQIFLEKELLDSKYGKPIDLSYFPAYADTPSSQATSIRLGSGRFFQVWMQKKWAVALIWDKDVAELRYQHNILIEKYWDSVDDGL